MWVQCVVAQIRLWTLEAHWALQPDLFKNPAQVVWNLAQWVSCGIRQPDTWSLEPSKGMALSSIQVSKKESVYKDQDSRGQVWIQGSLTQISFLSDDGLLYSRPVF